MSNKKEMSTEPQIKIGSIFTEVTAEETNAVLDYSALPILPLRDMVVFPRISVPVALGRESSIKLAQDAAKNNTIIGLFTQKSPEVESPGKRELYAVGVAARILKVIELPDGSFTALISALDRLSLKSIKKKTPYLTGTCEPLPEVAPDSSDTQMVMMIETVKDIYDTILSQIGESETRDVKFSLNNMTNLLAQVNFICSNSPLTSETKQQLLECTDLKERTMKLIEELKIAYQLMQIKAEIHNKTTHDLSRQQREHFLQQQIRTIQDELGGSVEDQEIDDLLARASKKKWPDSIKKHFEKEVQKLERYNASNPEYSILYTYLETLLELPWLKYSDEEIDIAKVQQILDRDHYGLDDVKERIVEQTAVMKLRGDTKAPILCLYGPPGVGKTSLGKSVAEALGREYARISLGGLHDESEIRGHRKTYIGAMPGRIISALKKCGTSNPVFVLDEIDKIGNDYKGDPSSALLEVLDPEQNMKFHDNFIDVDYDLSHVLFIATANDLSTVSRPLLDRMELIEINGYVTDEKIEIALRHLVPKVLEEHGFDKDDFTFSRDAVKAIIDNYTFEAGVRRLEKTIARVVRKIAVKKAKGETFAKEISAETVSELLGAPEVNPDKYENNDLPGIVTGLAWTQAGGEILFIESSIAPGKADKLTLTGNLGDVMKESASIALHYLKSHAPALGLSEKDFENKEIHIHVPEGAIPKDGPSAGITMFTSLASAFTGRRVKERLAMTGEITLRGKVLPVGGIKEKILAAKRAGIRIVILSTENKKDIDKIKEDYLKGLDFIYVEKASQVLDASLLPAD